MECTLCSSKDLIYFKGVDEIDFYRCNDCFLIFKAPEYWCNAEDEKTRYSHHNNTKDSGYVDFLNKALEPSLPYIKEDMEGLDFGCGPNPVLAEMVEETNCKCSYYDPFFFPELPDERQDFIFATECFEHFFSPSKEIKLLTALLRPSGTLTVMTNFWNENTNFKNWWYLKDSTHVAFYNKKTFNYISEHYGFTIEYTDGQKVIILSKKVVSEV